MKPFTESDKFDWELTPDSNVLDVGCFEGNFAYEIWRRYGCKVVAMEPIHDFYWQCVRKLQPVGCTVIPYGLDGRDHVHTRVFKVHGSMSGQFADGHPRQVTLMSPSLLMEQLAWNFCDLIKLNCEGSEFDILNHILEKDMAARFRNILVQPHTCVPDHETRWQAIDEGLQKTHEMVFHEDWCWSGYKLRT